MLIEASKVVEPSRIYKYPWIGEVVDNNDPKKLGRVKVTIAGLLEGDAASLPWVMMENSTGFGGNGTDSSFIVPLVGSKLNIHFMYDDIYFPVYRGFYQSANTHQSAFDSNYPNKFGIVSGETKLVIDRNENTVSIETANGVKINISSAGDLTIEGPTKIKIDAPEVILGDKLSGITTAQSHFNVVDFITGIQVIPSLKVFGDV
jgi:hypothetical protein